MAKPRTYHFSSPEGQPKGEMQAYVSADMNKAKLKITGRIYSWTAEDFEDYLQWLIEDGHQEIDVHLNGEGGDVYAMNNIVNSLNESGLSINVHTGAFVASAYTYALAKIKSSNRTAPSNVQAMIHKPSINIQGNVEELEAEMVRVRAMNAEYKAAYTQPGMFTEDELDTAWKADYWMTATMLKDKGFITSIRNEADEVSPELVALLTAIKAPHIPTPQAGADPKPAATPTPTNKDNQLSDMEKSRLLAKYGLPADATDAQLETAIDESLKAKGDLAAMQAKAKTDAAAQLQANAKKDIDQAIADKKITEAHRAGFMAKYMVDAEATKAELAAIVAVKPMPIRPGQGGGNPTANAGREAWTYQDWAEKDNKGLTAMLRAAREGDEASKAQFTALFESQFPNSQVDSLFQ